MVPFVSLITSDPAGAKQAGSRRPHGLAGFGLVLMLFVAGCGFNDAKNGTTTPLANFISDAVGVTEDTESIDIFVKLSKAPTSDVFLLIDSRYDSDTGASAASSNDFSLTITYPYETGGGGDDDGSDLGSRIAKITFAPNWDELTEPIESVTLFIHPESIGLAPGSRPSIDVYIFDVPQPVAKPVSDN